MCEMCVRLQGQDAPMTAYFQTPADPYCNRGDPIWVGGKDFWKCCLCGALTRTAPPPYPTPNGWLPERYELLTGEERKLYPEGRTKLP